MLLEQEEKKVDPRIKRTRQLLQQALMDLMKEKSFQSITVQDIAERATVNRVTFYAHFEDKYALLEHTIREMIRQQLRSQVPEDAPFSTESLTRLILTVCEFLAEMSRRCPLPHTQFEPLMEKQIKTELYEVLRAWLAKPSSAKSSHRPTPEQAAMVTSWAIYGAVLQWSQQERREPAREFVKQVLPLILAGLQLVDKVPVP
ncbi:MAG: TetR/AcrR family transcriptional regulator [Chloroflexi bacterium]|nr:TetR/AcrR family transcriptional regulator [Chloroflexota bacterium]